MHEMLETISDAEQFISENSTGDLILHPIPVHAEIHPAQNKLSILFIKNIPSGKIYSLSFDHPDSIPTSECKESVCGFLRKCSNKLWSLDKKTLHHLIDLTGVFDANLCGYLSKNEILEEFDYETVAHKLIRGNNGNENYGKYVPLVKHKEMFEEMSDDIFKMIRKATIDDSYLSFNHMIETLGNLERNGICVDRKLFKEKFDMDVGPESKTYSQYNVYTSTGRPSNRFGGINYAALNHTDGTRKCFVSRYGKDGNLLMVDYTAFHPRIICRLVNYDLPSTTDIYEYLARLYYNKKSVDETDIANAKRLTFKQLYGGVDDKYAHIKYLASLKDFIMTQWDNFKKDGYVETPIFKRKITEHHLQDPNPSKVFNYILQAVEGEIAIPILEQVMTYLDSKKKKTKAILYTYDSVLFDCHRDDGENTVKHILEIMGHQKMFPLKVYFGHSYQDLRLVSDIK